MTDGFVLVHGGFHGAWCWDPVIPLLARPAVAVDLPGRGARSSPAGPVTLDHCVTAVLADADAAGLERFVLVGHSLGGLTITETANRAPERLDRIIYVAALAPAVGETVDDLFFPNGDAPDRDLAGYQELLDEAVAHHMFAGDLDPAAFAPYHRRCTPEANGLFRASVSGYDHGVAVTYIQCSRDVAVPPPFAARMIANARADDVVTLDSDHDVMLSHPDLLASVLNRASG